MSPGEHALAGLTRTLLGQPLSETTALGHLRTACVVAMQREVDPARQSMVGDDVVADAWGRLSRATFVGSNPGEAWNFVKTTVSRLSMEYAPTPWTRKAERGAGKEASPMPKVRLVSLDEAADVPDPFPLLDAIEVRAECARLEHLRQVLVLLAGRGQRGEAVRSFLDYCLNRAEGPAVPDRTVANRLAKRRERGRDYVSALVAEHPTYFTDADSEILARLLGDEALSAAADRERLGEDKP